MALCDYEETITSYIHDDDKLVTYKWLSKELEIHVNVAKDILEEYWKKYKIEEKIVATYLLIGQLKDGSIRVEVVKESNLKVARDKFAQVNCQHLYSLQKYLEDIQLLAFAGDGDIRYSAIKCKDEYVRNDEEIDSLRYVGNTKKEENKPTEASKNATKNSTQDAQKPINSVKEKPIDSVKEKPKNLANKKDDSKQKKQHENKEKSSKDSESKPDVEIQVVEKKISPTSKPKSNSKVSKKPVQSKQSGFNHLFGKVANKPQTTNKPKEDNDEKLISSTITTEKKEKNSESPKEKDTKLEKQVKAKKSEKVEKENKSEKLENKKQSLQDKSTSISKTSNKSNDKTKSQGKNDARGKKRNRSQENSASSKRKRILVLDSSEDESGVSDKEEDEEPMEVEEEPAPVVRKRSPSPPAEKLENGKRMIRKTIDKTHKDEDGFLVTKRVHVYEAVSDTEEVTKEVKKEESKKQVPIETAAKKKQTTLMNFFKKS